MKATTHHTVYQGVHGVTEPCSNALLFRGDDGTTRLLDPTTTARGGDADLAASAPSPFAALCQQYGWAPATSRHTTQLAAVGGIQERLADVLAQLKEHSDQEVVRALWAVVRTLTDELYTVDTDYQAWMHEQAMQWQYEAEHGLPPF